jgi:hypothetical protein
VIVAEKEEQIVYFVLKYSNVLKIIQVQKLPKGPLIFAEKIKWYPDKGSGDFLSLRLLSVGDRYAIYVEDTPYREL